ncbi:MAG TPA: Fe-S protein assembly co-chaperone HscB [Blastocatellia bacterium]|nr:Fe-S protein assembly co-chaperone HscB [Blastocatellia bacterium]
MTEALIDTIGARSTVCAYCAAQSSDIHICSECGRIQPVAKGTDYFAFFGLSRKLRLDESALEKSFYTLSRRFHPDYFMNATEEERQSSLDRSSLLNDAYRTLRDPINRARYLLSLEGYKEAEKKAPPDLLEEVFELNMQVEELKAAKKMGDQDEFADARAALEGALASLSQKLGDLDQELFALFEEHDRAIESSDDVQKRESLDRMSELLSHRSYVQNLVRDIKEEL